jgi:hypothetical protein
MITLLSSMLADTNPHRLTIPASLEFIFENSFVSCEMILGWGRRWVTVDPDDFSRASEYRSLALQELAVWCGWSSSQGPIPHKRSQNLNTEHSDGVFNDLLDRVWLFDNSTGGIQRRGFANSSSSATNKDIQISPDQVTLFLSLNIFQSGVTYCGQSGIILVVTRG